MTSYIVYKHTCRENGKCYVGVTSGHDDPETLMTRRWQAHVRAARKSKTTAFGHAINKYGQEAFEHQVLETYDVRQFALDAEVRLIKECNSCCSGNGYNMTAGGEDLIGESNSNARLSHDDVASVKLAWNEAPPTTVKELRTFYCSHAARLNVTAGLICRIIKGRSWASVDVELHGVRSLRGKGLVGYKHTAATCQKMSADRSGEGNARAKITEADVIEIRRQFSVLNKSVFGAKSTFYRRWSAQLSVTSEQICGIANMQSWKHVPAYEGQVA